MKRNNYLMRKSLKNFLLASILSLAVANINTVIDSLIVGHVIGPDGIGAINVFFPILLVLNAVFIMVSSGTGMMIATALGSRRFDDVNKVFSASLLISLIFGAINVVLSFTLLDNFIGFLCNDEALFPLVKEYAFVQVVFSVILVLMNVFSTTLESSGKPVFAAAAMFISVGVNLVLDFLFIVVLRKSIGYSALATVLGNAVALIFMIIVARKTKVIKLVLISIKNFLNITLNVFKNGSALMFVNLSFALVFQIYNFFIQKSVGTNGMFVMGVGANLIQIGIIISNGVTMSYMSIGSTLTGENDLRGLNFFWKSCLKLGTIMTLLFCIVISLAAAPIAKLYGSNTEALLALSQSSIPFIMSAVPHVALSGFMSVVYQIGGFFKFSKLISVFPLLISTLSFMIVTNVLPAEKIWWAFPFTTLLYFVFHFLIAFIVYKKEKGKFSFFSLIPKVKENSKNFDISIQNEKNRLVEALEEVYKYCSSVVDEKNSKKIFLCIEELLKNILEHAERNSNHFIDLRIISDNNKITASIRDDGIPFNPVTKSIDKNSFGLKLLRGFCKKIDYRFAFGQNNVILEWEFEE